MITINNDKNRSVFSTLSYISEMVVPTTRSIAEMFIERFCEENGIEESQLTTDHLNDILDCGNDEGLLEQELDSDEFLIYTYYHQAIVDFSETDESDLAANFGHEFIGKILEERGMSGIVQQCAIWCFTEDCRDALEAELTELLEALETANEGE